MFARINIIKIIKDHLGTLTSLNSSRKGISFPDLILFIFIPLVIAFFLVYFDFTFEKQLNKLITAISIFGGFLFNLLAIIYSQTDSIKRDAKTENNKLKIKFVQEIHINISFCIVISIFLVIALLLTTIDIPQLKFAGLIRKGIIGINYFLMTLFLLTLLMIINRIYILLKKENNNNIG